MQMCQVLLGIGIKFIFRYFSEITSTIRNTVGTMSRFVLACSRLPTATISGTSPPLAIQEVIFNRDFLNKTKLEYLHGDEDKKSHL